MKKYLVYCRKSSEEDRKQYQSLETQERIIVDFAQANNLEIVQIFRESRSARFSGNRPLFLEMVNMIKAGKANGILAYHVDRLSRNLKEAGEITELMDRGLLLEVKTPSDTYVTSSDLLKMNINYVFAENYSRELSEKVRAGNETKLKKGEYPSMARLGYVNVKNGIIPDPNRAQYISRIFELYATGSHSIKTIAEIMFQEGLRSRKNKKLYKSSIERILKCPEYYGVIQRKGVLYIGNHEPLISKDLFEKVQERFQQKTSSRPKNLFFLYRNYLICHQCGCKLTATTKKGKYTYYYCTNTKGVCTQHRKYIKESEIESEMLDLIKKFIPDKKLLELSLNRYLYEKRKQILQESQQAESLENSIKSVEKRLINLENMYLDDRITGERYDVKKSELQKELTDLQLAKKATKRTNKKNTLELVENFKNKVISLWETFYDGNPDVKKEILESVLWNCGILDKKILTTRYKLPYTYMKKFHQTKDLEKLSAVIDYFRTFL